MLKEAIGCGFCGSKIISLNQDQALNHLEFEQKGDSKKFKATFTDNVGSDLVATFGGMIGVPPIKKKLGTVSQLKLNSESSSGIANPDVEDADEEEISEALLKVFRLDNDKLVLQTANLKTQVKLDKEIRIALLTLLAAKFLLKQEDTKRSFVTELLNKAKLNTSSFRAWINKSEEIGQKGGGYVFLTTNGLPIALSVLYEIINPEIIEGSVTFSKPKSGRRRTKTSTEASGDPIKKSAKSPKEYLLKLLEEEPSFFKTNRTLSEITQHLKDNYAVTFITSDISGHMGKLVNSKVLKRVKGTGESKIYEYFI